MARRRAPSRGEPGPVGALARLGRVGQARQVTTHTHDAVPLEPYAAFRQLGHWDYKTIPAGGTWAFPELRGPGCVTAFWCTVAGRMLEVFVRWRVPAHRFLWLHVYYDGADTPAVSAPLGLFFGNGTTRYVHYSSKYVGMTSGGYYSFLPLPFARSCRVVLENRHARRDIPFFFGALTYHELDALPADAGILHTQHRARTFTGSGDVAGEEIPNDPHLILDEDRGPGQFAGLSLTQTATHPIRSRFRGPYFGFPYLEGNLKVYVDDEVQAIGPPRIRKPAGAPRGPQSIEHTGVEDYFLSGWYYKTAPFGAHYHGCPVRSYLTGAVAQFRFHELDPYPWQERIRVTVTHGEFDEVDCRMESLAYYYLRPER